MPLTPITVIPTCDSVDHEGFLPLRSFRDQSGKIKQLVPADTVSQPLFFKKDVCYCGGFSRMYVGMTGDGELRAVKAIQLQEPAHPRASTGSPTRDLPKLKPMSSEKVLHEFNLMRRFDDLDDSIIVQNAKGSKAYILQPLMSGTLLELFEHLRGCQPVDLVARYVLQQACLELKKIHDERCIHFDIKSENILYDQKTRRLKIVDFGFARKGLQTVTPGGTGNYFAPEQLTARNTLSPLPVSAAVDVFALGATVIDLVFNRVTFEPGDQRLITQGWLDSLKVELTNCGLRPYTAGRLVSMLYPCRSRVGQAIRPRVETVLKDFLPYGPLALCPAEESRIAEAWLTAPVMEKRINRRAQTVRLEVERMHQPETPPPLGCLDAHQAFAPTLVAPAF